MKIHELLKSVTLTMLLDSLWATTSGAHFGEKTTIYYNPANPEREYYLNSDAYGFFLGVGIGLIITILGSVFYKRASR